MIYSIIIMLCSYNILYIHFQIPGGALRYKAVYLVLHILHVPIDHNFICEFSIEIVFFYIRNHKNNMLIKQNIIGQRLIAA